MNKSKANFIIDVLMFIVMMTMAGQGFLLEYVLVHGREVPGKYGFNADLYFFGLDRHAWGDIHLVLGFILLGLLVLHIVLHWQMISVMYRRLITNSKSRRIITLLFIMINLLLIFFFLLFKPEFREFDRSKGRGRYTLDLEHSGSPGKRVEEPETKRQEVNEDHQCEGDSSIEVSGRLTLGMVSKTYHVPLDYLIQKLGLPPETSSAEKLGSLRRTYEFKMSDVEKIIRDYKKGAKAITGKEHKAPSSKKTSEPGSKSNRANAEQYRQSGRSIEITGRLTLGMVSRTYNVPLDYLIQKLGLPAETSAAERLGWLRRTYGFRMSDVEKIIRQYHELQ
jgi:hypothetical protein